MTEAEIKQATETCRFFNGTQSGTCEAGVRYDSFESPGIPCILRFNRNNHKCGARQATTREEAIAQHEADEKTYQDLVKRMAAVAPVVNACRKIAGRTGGRYERECDACGTGRLHIAIASNGHARVCCTTDGCVNWRE